MRIHEYQKNISCILVKQEGIASWRNHD